MTSARPKPSLKKRLSGFKQFISHKMTTQRSNMSRTTSMPSLHLRSLQRDDDDEVVITPAMVRQKRNSLFIPNGYEHASFLRPDKLKLQSFERPRSECFHLPEEDESLASPPMFKKVTSSQSVQEINKLTANNKSPSLDSIGSNWSNSKMFSSSIDSATGYRDLERTSSSYAESSVGDENDWSDNGSYLSNQSLDSRQNLLKVPDANNNYIVHLDTRSINNKQKKKLRFPKPHRNQNNQRSMIRSSSFPNQSKQRPSKKLKAAPMPPLKPEISLLHHKHDHQENTRVKRTESIKKSVSKTRSFSVKKRRSTMDKKRRLSAESKDIFENIYINFSNEDLQYLMQLEVEAVLLNKQYDQNLCLRWCKEISTKIRDKLRHKLERTYKVVVSSYIGPCRDSNEDTVHVAMKGVTDPDKDRFLTVALHSKDLFVWVTLCMFEVS